MKITPTELKEFKRLCNEADGKDKIVVGMTPNGPRLVPLKEDWDEVNDFIARMSVKHGFDLKKKTIHAETGEVVSR